MNREEIKNRFREENSEITDRRVPDTTLDSWCKEADKNFCARVRCIVGDTTFVSVVSEDTYDLTSKIDKFFDIDEFPGGGVAFNDKRLKLKTIAQWNERRSSWRTASNGTPVEYVKRGQNIILNCPVASAYDINIYTVLISDDFDDDSKTPFNQLNYLEPFHYAIVLFLSGKAKQKVGKPDEKVLAMSEYESYVKWAKTLLQGSKMGKISFRRP